MKTNNSKHKEEQGSTLYKAIYFDMDGTIADLYSQDNWLNDLRSYNAAPYSNAKPMVNIDELKRVLVSLRNKGYTIGIITWLAKVTTNEYNNKVRAAKLNWLNTYFGVKFFDEIHMVKYGTPKHKVAKVKNAILFDDSEAIRTSWNGLAKDENCIIETLHSL